MHFEIVIRPLGVILLSTFESSCNMCVPSSNAINRKSH